jgi:hypothetical protein
MTEPSQIKLAYGPEAIAFWTRVYLDKCRQARAEAGLIELSDALMIKYALEHYMKMRRRINRKKSLKSEETNGN